MKDKEINDAKEQLKIILNYRRRTLYSFKMLMTANNHIAAFNNSFEANIVNHLTWLLYENMVVNLRKIVEPKNKKRSTIQNIVEIINNNKELLLSEYYKEKYDEDINIIDYNGIKKSLVLSVNERKERAITRKNRVKENIDNLNIEWNNFWNSDCSKLKKARDDISHSNKEINIKFPSINTIKEIIDKITSMIEKIDLIINLNSYSYNLESEGVEDMANKFWQSASEGYKRIKNQ